MAPAAQPCVLVHTWFMPAYPKLPDLPELDALRREGHTNKDIADRYGTSVEAVRQKFAKHGVVNENGRHARGTSPRREDSRAVVVFRDTDPAVDVLRRTTAAALRRQATDLLELANKLDPVP